MGAVHGSFDEQDSGLKRVDGDGAEIHETQQEHDFEAGQADVLLLEHDDQAWDVDDHDDGTVDDVDVAEDWTRCAFVGGPFFRGCVLITVRLI